MAAGAGLHPRHLRPCGRCASAPASLVASGRRLVVSATATTDRPDERRGWWARLCDQVLGREIQVAVVDVLDTSVSFAELVWAHYQRQQEVYAGETDGPWEQIYRERLTRFKREHGDIRKDYWCRYQASGVALTARRRPRRPRTLWRHDEILRLHSVTDWRTAAIPEITTALHRWQTLAIKASEILRDSTEHIVLEQIFEGMTRLLAAADQPDATMPSDLATDKSHPSEQQDLSAVLTPDKEQLLQVQNHYSRAGENSARIVYFKGMIIGAGLCGIAIAFAVLALWGVHGWHPHRAATQELFASVAMGAAGAIVSVMGRMASPNGFNLDFEVGRKSVRRLGSLRPWIGATFALAIYLALKSSLLQVGQVAKPDIYFYATIAFLAGFSERRAKVLLEGVSGDLGSGGTEPTHLPARAKSQ